MRVLVSHAAECRHELLAELDAATEPWGGRIEIVEESAADLIAHLAAQADGAADIRIRYAARDRVDPAVRRAAVARGLWLADVPVVAQGRLELLWYVREQSVSFDYHRYGNLGHRASEPRRAVK